MSRHSCSGRADWTLGGAAGLRVWGQQCGPKLPGSAGGEWVPVCVWTDLRLCRPCSQPVPSLGRGPKEGSCLCHRAPASEAQGLGVLCLQAPASCQAVSSALRTCPWAQQLGRTAGPSHSPLLPHRVVEQARETHHP